MQALVEMIDFRYHSLAVLLALRVEARTRAGKSILPTRLIGRGDRDLPSREGEMAVLASRRAVARLCRLNTCLTRSIVLFQLLERRYRVKLEMGFRSGSEGPDGHAWVTVDGVPLGEHEENLETFTTVG